MKILAVLLLALVANGCRSTAHPPAAKPDATDIRQIHPAPGTSIVRFGEIDDGIFRGSKPQNDADFAFLQSKGVKYILKLRLFPFLSASEGRKAKAHGMTLITATINASPVQPSKKHIDLILCLLRDKRLHPIYFHCDLGRDRTSLIAALYAVYFRGVSTDEAWQKAERFGFKDDWTLRGLKQYFQVHTQPPIDRHIPDCSSEQQKQVTPREQAAEEEPQPCEGVRSQCENSIFRQGENFVFRQGTASQPAEKRRTCHPEPALFAGEGSAVRKKVQEKSRFLTPFKTERGEE
jgi:hypothetical protein